MGRERITVFLAGCLSIISEFVNEYMFCDWQFFTYLTILMFLDLILGVWKHIILETISSAGWGKAIKKFVIYGIVLILAHVMENYSINGTKNILFAWMPIMMYSILMVKESISILENIGVIYPNFIPKWLLSKLKEYDKNGKFKTN
jgi:phage-related holin